MENIESKYNFEKLSHITLAPWIAQAKPLIFVPRKIGGNMFRHQMATMTILLDYGYIHPVLLKASVIHDLIEDVPQTNIADLLAIDSDAKEVVDLVLEVTKREGEEKKDFLKRILYNCSFAAKLIKCADRISNMIDLQQIFLKDESIIKTIDETEEYVLPMAEIVNKCMYVEIEDLIKKKREQLYVLNNRINLLDNLFSEIQELIKRFQNLN